MDDVVHGRSALRTHDRLELGDVVAWVGLHPHPGHLFNCVHSSWRDHGHRLDGTKIIIDIVVASHRAVWLFGFI